MKRLIWCMWWTWALLVVMGSGGMGCLEEERNALLGIKAAFNSPNGSSLSSWSDDYGSNCCGWKRVVCDNATSRVARLYLNNTRHPNLGAWVINASLFLPLEELQVLDLSKNHLSGPNLEVLDILGNTLANDALLDIARITSLKALDIKFGGLSASTLMEGSLSLASLADNSNLEVFHLVDNHYRLELLKGQHDLRGVQLNHNGMRGNFPNWLLDNNVNLDRLELIGNELSGTFHLPSNLSLANMGLFDVSANTFEGELPTSIGFNLPNLDFLNFSNNLLSGGIPPSMGNMQPLESLDLSNNSFTGEIPETLTKDCPNLEVLDLLDNNLANDALSDIARMTSVMALDIGFGGLSASKLLEGSHSLASLANNSNLEVFHLFDNCYPLEVNTEDHTWFPSFQLKVFSLSNCVLNKDANGVIPSFLKGQYDLRGVQLNHNGMKGNFPNWLLNNNVNLERLELTGNELSGAFHLPSNLSLANMWLFDVSANIIKGELPSSISSILPNLQFLNFSNNLLRGGIPPSMGNMQLLLSLDLSNNGFTGEIPETLAKDSSSIVTLDLRQNALSGEIPKWIGSLRNLRVLLLQGDNFEGSIPPNLCLLKKISIPDLSNNNLYGKIPSCLNSLPFGYFKLPPFLGDMVWIEYWEPRDNRAGFQLMYRYQYREMVLSTNIHRLEEVNFITKSRLESSKGNILNLMSGMDLSQNNLIGFTPLELGYLRELRALNLSHNHLIGSIPGTFSNLQNVESLDLSYNSLTGPIPPQLTNLYALSIFSVAHNNLSGSYVVAFLGVNLFLYLNLYYRVVHVEFSGADIGDCRMIHDPRTISISYRFHTSKCAILEPVKELDRRVHVEFELVVSVTHDKNQEKLVFTQCDAAEIEPLFNPVTCVDALLLFGSLTTINGVLASG
ncbi:receptor-like protein 15 [Eucalyptus grandis]|uniref:receptor-like protein 15 n=1 Tax=Eucalyptus grandis TaxID=71139 RepID=UPI00192EB8B9|nr:receptor-like protein 15 [Eucalyptus grandis]